MTRALFLRIVLGVLLLSSVSFAQSSRWELVTVSAKGYRFYLDTTTVKRPEPGVVVFWYKQIQPNEEEGIFLVKMWFEARKVQMVELPGGKPQNIVPDSVMEAFLKRLDR